VVLFSLQICPKYSSLCEEFSDILSYIYVQLHAEDQIFFSYFNQTSIFSKVGRKILKHRI